MAHYEPGDKHHGRYSRSNEGPQSACVMVVMLLVVVIMAVIFIFVTMVVATALIIVMTVEVGACIAMGR